MAAPKTTKRRARERLTDQLETLLHAMTFDQLKTVLSIVSPGPESRPRTWADAEAQILGCGKPVEAIEKALYAVEAATPYQHCFVARLSTTASPKTKVQLRLGFDVRLVYKSNHDDVEVLTFERDIRIKDWSLDEKSNTKRPVETSLRHPAVVRVNRNTAMVTINYPSFPQWHSTPPRMRLGYAEFVGSVLEYLDEKYDIRTEPLPTRECINRLLEAKSDRLVLRRAHTIPDSGRLSVATTRYSLSVEKLLARHYGPYLEEISIERLEDAMAEATRNSSMESMVVLWTLEDLVTRLDFWDNGTELFFTWYDTDKGYVTIDSVVDLIVKMSHEIQIPERRDVWDQLSAAAPDHIFLPGDLTARWKLPSEDIKSVLMDAVTAGIIEPVYNYNTSEVLEDGIEPDWTSDLPKLNRAVRTASGAVIDGTNPAQIKIAFRRTRPRRMAQ